MENLSKKKIYGHEHAAFLANGSVILLGLPSSA